MGKSILGEKSPVLNRQNHQDKSPHNTGIVIFLELLKKFYGIIMMMSIQMRKKGNVQVNLNSFLKINRRAN